MMTRLEWPLLARTLQSTGDELLRAELKLAIKSNQGQWVEVTFDGTSKAGARFGCLIVEKI
jgi:hypothetical protein